MLRCSSLAVAAALCLGSLPVDGWSLGFGRGPTSATLGASLDFQVPLRLDPGETLSPECLSADVLFGESMVPRSSVSVSLLSSPSGQLVRVRTSVAIDEPLVSVVVVAGCESRVSRRFTVFADPQEVREAPRMASAEAVLAGPISVQPPAATASPTGLAAGPAAGVPPTASTGTPVRDTAPPTAAVGASPPSAAAPPAASPVGSEAEKTTAAGLPPGKPPVADVAKGGGAPRTDVSPREAKAPKSPPKVAASESSTTGAAPSTSPRLKLDGPSGPKSAAARLAEQEAALKAAQDAALAAEAAATAAQARSVSLEKTLEAIQKDAKANREAVARLTEALAQAQRQQSDSSEPLWAALAAAGLALAGVLGVAAWRRRQAAAGAAWTQATPLQAEQPPAPAPSPEPSLEDVRAVAEAPSPAPAEPISTAAPVTSGVVDTQGGGVTGPVSAAPIRNVSVEELLDLEQQVEFFTVLGQDEPAAELLSEHVRKTGGTHPLPYLKMLELYRRMGDRDAYERTRTRFNQRFNALAPAFDAPQEAERVLEDYPLAMERIQKTWRNPVDAMAVLENMLVRAEGREGFGVSALAEVLFLFTLARDVHQQRSGAGSEAADVDVLIPFADSRAFPDSRDFDGTGKPSGSLSVNFDEGGESEMPAMPAPVSGPSARFGITVGVSPEEMDRLRASEITPLVPAPTTASQGDGSVDFPLGPSLMGSLDEAPAVSSASADIPLGPSVMGDLEPPPADATVRGRSQLPMPDDQASVDFELGGSMMGSLFGDLPTSKAPAAAAPPLPSLEIDLEFEQPSVTPPPPPPAPVFEINLEGLELEPRPAPAPQEPAEDAPGSTPKA